MPKLTEYPQATSFDQNDILIKDGTNGTKKIAVEDAAIEFAALGGLGPEIQAINDFIFGEPLTGWSEPGYFIKTNEAPINVNSPSTASSTPNVRYLVVPCQPYDIFTVSCRGGSTSRSYTFVDQSGGIVGPQASASTTISDQVLLAPEGAVYLVCNDIYGTGNVRAGRQYTDTKYTPAVTIGDATQSSMVLSSGADLNKIVEPGNYRCGSNSTGAALINSPINTTFRMIVMALTVGNVATKHRIQIIIPSWAGDTNKNSIWYRKGKMPSGGEWSWSEWINLGGAYADTRVLNGIPALELTGDMTGISKDDAVTMNYDLLLDVNAAATSAIHGVCTVKWQGSSSQRYEKKNYTIKFTNTRDPDTGALSSVTPLDGWLFWIQAQNNYRRTISSSTTLPPNISTSNPRYAGTDHETQWWGEQTKFCTKANWIDASAARNIVCARLWAEMVKARVDAGEITDDRQNAPNYGAIDGFPIFIKINGTPQGLYTFNIPKDAWQFAMGGRATEYVVSGEGNGNKATQWKSATAAMDGSDFSVEYKDSDSISDSTIATSLNAAIAQAVSAGSDWETTLANYVDINSVFDYFIFTCCIANNDALARNILYGTYDGTKWFMSAYDMDTTFGFDPYGLEVFDVKGVRTNFAAAANMHRLAYLMYTYSKTKLKNRYKMWREGGITGGDGSYYEGWVQDGTYVRLKGMVGQVIPDSEEARANAKWNTTTAADGKFIIIPCSPGDFFTVTTTGQDNPRAFGFADSSKVLLESPLAANGLAVKDYVLQAPANAAYLIVNDASGNGYVRQGKIQEAILSDGHVWKMLTDFVKNIPSRDYDADRNTWPLTPGTSVMTVPQYMEYYRMHCKYLDAEIDALT